MNNDFRKYATKHLGINGLVLDEVMSAQAQYISLLNTFWTDYYSLQKSTLHDWTTGRDIYVDIENAIDNN